jgi:hypothetical protein
MLLEYVVRETLDNRGENLKERAIGVAVFGRTPTYDTNEDPIVRTTAVEVRKRIAQYYHEAGNESGVHIEMTSGSYVPQFLVSSPARRTMVRVARPRRRMTMVVAAVVAIVLLAAALLWWRAAVAKSPLETFWDPISRADLVVLAMGDVSEMPSGRSFAENSQADRVGFVDGMTMARVAALLRGYGTKFEIRRAGSLELRDLRRSPAVLIGEMNNPWARLVEGDMRFRFVWDQASHVVRLEDRQNPGKPMWQVDWQAPYANLREDRAIISRVVDPRTEHAVLVLAGCGRDGTAAAGEFVTDRKYMDALEARAPRGWGSKNLQILIATDLINGNSGPPRIIASHFW